MVKAVIFDMDGTLVDSVDLHAKAWQDAFRDFGHQFELKAIRDQIGKGGDHLLPVFLTREEIDTKGPDLEKHRGKILKERYLSQIKGVCLTFRAESVSEEATSGRAGVRRLRDHTLRA
jgi:beta-phosphoglucomutase-like phosphatase (HAD superfamily)